MDSVINLKLMSHPLNWITIAVWLFALGIASVALGLTTPATAKPTSPASTTQ